MIEEEGMTEPSVIDTATAARDQLAERQARAGPPVAEEARLDVLQPQRFAQ